jgi:hypothetical protein
MRRAQGKPLAGVGTHADQMPAFLHALVAAASTVPRTVVVVTLAEAQAAYDEENKAVRNALDEASRVLARQELVLRPTRDEEVASVVIQRLFEKVDRDAAAEVARTYHSYYQTEQGGAGLPSRATPAEYRHEIEHTYPFHPELLHILTTKTATIPEFQRTRGALRLLARIVRSVWEHREEDAWLIHPFHLDFADEETRTELTGRLGREAFEPVIEADIYRQSGDSHAQELDRDWVARGTPPLASRLARTIYLHSLTHGRAGKAEVPDLLLATVQPGLDIELLREAIERLQDTCWYLDHDANSYWFGTEAQLPKIIDDEREQVTTAASKEECRKRIRSIYSGGLFKPVFFPERPADIDDTEDKLKLAVMDFDAFAVGRDAEVPRGIAEIYERAGTSGGFRQYKNALLFLLADRDQTDRMLDTARTYVALGHIVASPDILGQLNERNQRKAKTRYQRAEVELRVAITRAYRHLLVPNPDATNDPSGLQRVPLDVEEAARVEEEHRPGVSGQSRVIMEALAEAGKLMRPDGPPPAPALIAERAWPHGQRTMTAADLLKVFRSNPRLPMLLDVHRLRATVVKGVEEEKWVYFDGHRIWTKQTGAPQEADIRLDAQHELWQLMEASDRGYCLKCGFKPCKCEPMPQRCPICGSPKLRCQCLPCPRCGKKPWACTCAPVQDFRSTRTAPQKAFTELSDWAKDNKIQAIACLVVECYDRLSDLQQVWIGMQNFMPLENIKVTFEGSIQLARTVECGEAASVQRDLVRCSYEGGAAGFRRVYEFFHGTGTDKDTEDVGYASTFDATLVKPLPPGAGEIDDLRRRLVDGAVEQITLRAKVAQAESTSVPRPADSAPDQPHQPTPGE